MNENDWLIVGMIVIVGAIVVAIPFIICFTGGKTMEITVDRYEILDEHVVFYLEDGGALRVRAGCGETFTFPLHKKVRLTTNGFGRITGITHLSDPFEPKIDLGNVDTPLIAGENSP